MATILQSHREHAILESNIRFYALEINFLLKILTREYGIMASKEKIKMLDSFWKEFEKYGIKMCMLSEKIQKKEHGLHVMYAKNPENTPENISREETIMSEFSATVDELKLLKQSLYDYLENLPSNKC
jgi:hypothetical protein